MTNIRKYGNFRAATQPRASWDSTFSPMRLFSQSLTVKQTLWPKTKNLSGRPLNFCFPPYKLLNYHFVRYFLYLSSLNADNNKFFSWLGLVIFSISRKECPLVENVWKNLVCQFTAPGSWSRRRADKCESLLEIETLGFMQRSWRSPRNK